MRLFWLLVTIFHCEHFGAWLPIYNLTFYGYFPVVICHTNRVLLYVLLYTNRSGEPENSRCYDLTREKRNLANLARGPKWSPWISSEWYRRLSPAPTRPTCRGYFPPTFSRTQQTRNELSIMQSVINSMKGTALGVAEYLTPVLKVIFAFSSFFLSLAGCQLLIGIYTRQNT